MKIFPVAIDRFSTDINRDVNRKAYLCTSIYRDMRKLKITEMNRLSAEEFKAVEKLPLVVVLDNVRSLHNIGSVFRTSDAFRVECIYHASPSRDAQDGTWRGIHRGLEIC